MRHIAYLALCAMLLPAAQAEWSEDKPECDADFCTTSIQDDNGTVEDLPEETVQLQQDAKRDAPLPLLAAAGALALVALARRR